ncbi:unnamed protein product [Lymnaea stagnalis]|uniref:Cyanocobalamin reductase (cyanide-eliminating) n=1 Tax=Lymnaea stagnalis TaxID=6523 RepID=A0AAV2I2Q7_LYMST
MGTAHEVDDHEVSKKNIFSQKKNDTSEIVSKLRAQFLNKGLEIYPFKVGWYNDEVEELFHFNFDPDTLAVLVVSTPDMFERALVPFMCSDDCTGTLDLLDKCMKHNFSLVRRIFPDEDIEIMHDFEMTPSRRPKVLVQPAAHVAGAAYYYTARSLAPNPFKQKIFGVCIHPVYGGWFALRGVFIFKSVRAADLPRIDPVDCVPEQEKRVELLDLFNNYWKDNRYRDIISVEKKYSEDQKRYFSTLPKDRGPLIKELIQKYKGINSEEQMQKKEMLTNNNSIKLCNSESNSQPDYGFHKEFY